MRTLIVVLGLTLTVGAARRAHAQTAPEVTVTSTGSLKLPEPLDNIDLVDEVTKALEGSGCLVRGVCRTDDCRAPLHGAANVVRVDATFPPGEFSCKGGIELRSAGAVRFRQVLDRTSCPAAFLLKDAKQAAVTACEDLKRTAPVSIKAPAPVLEIKEVRREEPEDPGFRAWVPAVVTGTGAVILAAGVGLLVWDGRTAACERAPLPGERCEYDTRALGIGALVTGGAVLAGGITWWVIREQGASMKVSVGPGILGLQGRF